MNLDELYAKLVIKKGINLKKGEEVFINSSVETADFARKLCACAYENGAKKVIVNYTDEQITLLKLMHEEKETLEKIDAWQIAQKDYIPDNRCAYINILSSNPDAYSNADGEKLTALSLAQRIAIRNFTIRARATNSSGILSAIHRKSGLIRLWESATTRLKS